MEQVLAFLSAHGSDLVVAATSIVGGFAIISTFTPTKVDDKILGAIVRVIHLLGANFGKAANKK